MDVKARKERKYDRLLTRVYADKAECGRAAAGRAIEVLRDVLQQKGSANVVFSTGSSQFAFVEALSRRKDEFDWGRVNAFHLDEYVGISSDHPASFRLWLRQRVADRLCPGSFTYIEGDADDPDGECRRYEQVLRENPIDLAFVGIGENGHIAFNDPPVADFEDPRWVNIVELDEACRRQQVGEGWFPSIADVPRFAITMTVPAIMACRRIISVVPEKRKARAVKATLEEPVSTACPASILRTHQAAELYLDEESACFFATSMEHEPRCGPTQGIH